MKTFTEYSDLKNQMLTNLNPKFMDYVAKFEKGYATTEEYEFRANLFDTRDSVIQAFNSDDANTHILGHNAFSDRTPDEMKMMNGYTQNSKSASVILDVDGVAESVDWREKGAVTAVKDQGHCGSCWAFSATGSIESAYFIKHRTLKSFSEQQLLDCANGSWLNYGCMGGNTNNAFKYIEQFPLEEESAYPYKAKEFFTCQATKSKERGYISGFIDVQKGSIIQLKAALNKTPVSVAIEADQVAFQSYVSGVITTGCGRKIDHAVLAVGYGELDGEEYFLVKNSWGAIWGDFGYVRIGVNNVCGILDGASYPLD